MPASCAGLAPTGVVATDDIDDILALGADCVLYMPPPVRRRDVCRLLESGANIVTTRGEFHHPASMDPTVRQRVEAACRQGGTSIHSTGSSPGFISEAVPLVLTSIQRRLDSLVIEEFADLSQRDSPELLFDLMGFGTRPGAFDHGRWSYGAQSFGPSLRLVAEALSASRSTRWRPAERWRWPAGPPTSPPEPLRPARWRPADAGDRDAGRPSRS